MNRTSFSCVAFAVFFLGATAAEAVPIRYSADWVAGTFASGDPAGLAGAHVHVEAIVDPATLTPTVGPGYTSWRSSGGGFTSVVQMTISGSAHADGTYSGFSVGWDFYNDSGYSSGAFQVDPPADLVLEGPFEVWPGGYDMTIGQLVLALPGSFTSPASDGTLFPFPFENSDLIAQAPVYMRYETVPEDGGSYAYGYNVSARAESVPEPAAWILGLFGAIGLLVGATCRRRYGCNPRSALRKAQRTSLRHAALLAYAILIVLLANVGPANAAKIWNTGDLITYNQASWGGDPSIDPISGQPIDPGAALLVDKFNTVYASTSGVIVGLPSGGYSMIFTDASSALAYQPSIGPFGPLNASVLNPISTASGAFGGEVLGLEFNVDFSDAGFLSGTSGIPLGDLVLYGFAPHSSLEPLNGLTVRQFLGAVNTLLGGGASIITIDDLGTTLGGLNGSFFAGQPYPFAQDHLLPPAVPEPSSWLLLALGLVGLAWTHMRIRPARASRLT